MSMDLVKKFTILLNQSDEDQLAEFVSKNDQKLLQTWSANNSSNFVELTNDFINLLRVPITGTVLLERLIDFFKDFLSNHMKLITRRIIPTKTANTTLCLKLLNQIVSFRQGYFIGDFMDHFDFNDKTVPLLLIPVNTKKTSNTFSNKNALRIRDSFLRLWLTLLGNSSSFIRKELCLLNKSIINNWFKYLNHDSESLVLLTIETVDSKLLEEPKFPKNFKCKILNEFFLIKLVEIWNLYQDTDAIKKSTFDLLLKISTDPKNGLIFPDDKFWFVNTSNTKGAIKINNKSFKISNKLIYTLIINLKPWENESHLQLIMKIFAILTELIPPYNNYLISHSGYHDPKLSSFWIGQNLLLTNIISLPLPENLAINNLSKIDNNLVIENIIPGSFSKSSLIKSLQSESLLIKQLTCQTIIFMLRKFKAVVSFYNDNNWLDLKLSLTDEILNKLPEISIVTTVLNEVATSHSDKKILILTLNQILNEYYGLFPANLTNGATSLTSNFNLLNNTLLGNTEFSGLDLVLLDNYLNLTDLFNMNIKWWTKQKNSQYSLFTLLIKIHFTSSNGSIKAKIETLLINLISPFNLFNPSIISQMKILLFSLNSSDLDSLWNLIDQTILHGINSRYKLYDLSNKQQNLSPFIICLLDQLKFVKENIPVIKSWVAYFANYLMIIGEPKQRLLDSLSNNDVSPITIEYNKDNESFVNYIISLSYKEKITHSPQSELELVALLYKTKLIIEDENITLDDNVMNFLIELLSKVGNYLLINHNKDYSYYNKKFWSYLFISKLEDQNNEKLLFSSNLFNEILTQLPSRSTQNEFKSWILSIISSQSLTNEVSTNLINSCLWVLSDEEITSNLNSESSTLNGLLNEMITRKLNFDSKFIIELLKQKSVFSIHQVFQMKLIEFRESNDRIELVDLLIAGKKYDLLQFLLSDSGILEHMLKNFEDLNDDLLCVIGYSITEEQIRSLSEGDNEAVLRDFFKKISAIGLQLIKAEDFNKLPLNNLLRLFINSFDFIDRSDVDSLLQNCLNLNDKSLFLPELCQLVVKFVAGEKASLTENKPLTSWLIKSCLYITKRLAEFDDLSVNFELFVSSFQALMFHINIWDYVPATLLNSQLEVIFMRWIDREFLIIYSNLLILSNNGNKAKVDYEKLLQMFINNESNSLLKTLPSEATSKLRFYSSLIIWKLFNFNVSKNSQVSVQEKVLLFYSGSIRPEDLLLKDLLIKLESKLSKSWINNVYNWDLIDEVSDYDIELLGETRLVAKDSNGLVISLNKGFIKNSIKNFNYQSLVLPTLKNSGLRQNWDSINVFLSHLDTLIDASYQQTVYDTEFLLMLVINNEELLSIDKEGTSKFDIKKIVDSNFLEFIVLNLASDSVKIRSISKVLLNNLLRSLDLNENFKDKNLFKVFISNILLTLKKESEANTESDSSKTNTLFWYFMAKLIPIFINPGHFLYEKAYRFVLTNPSLRITDIPLFKSISTSENNDDGEENTYYKQLVWLLETLTQGLKSDQDLYLVQSKGVIEWALNLFQSSYTNLKTKCLIIEFISVIQKINNGSNLLITRFSILSFLEINLRKLDLESHNEKMPAKEMFSLEQLQINIKQLLLRFNVTSSSNKRIRDWTFDDIDDIVKRTHV